MLRGDYAQELNLFAQVEAAFAPTLCMPTIQPPMRQHPALREMNKCMLSIDDASSLRGKSSLVAARLLIRLKSRNSM
jgi:hypothetical protein